MSRVLRMGWLRLGVLEHDRGAVGDDLDHLAADFGGVEAQPDHRVCSKLLRLGCHPRERLSSDRGEVAPVLVERTAVPERIQPGHDVAADAAAADGDADHGAQVGGDPRTRDLVRRGDADGGIVSCAHVRWGRTLCRRCIARSFRDVRPIRVVPRGYKPHTRWSRQRARHPK
jgi:hypothetical protein